jgi:hypothetical protein
MKLYVLRGTAPDGFTVTMTFTVKKKAEKTRLRWVAEGYTDIHYR